MPEHTPSPTPSRGVYGFILYLSFKIFFITYCVWALIPEQWFVSIGITYLPKRYWAIVIPMFLLTVLAMFAFIIYPSLGLIMTPSIDDPRTIRDGTVKNMKGENFVKFKSDSNKNCCVFSEKCHRLDFEKQVNNDFLKNCIPSLKDISISDVSKHLYLK